jgi:hypothetical protein
MPIANRIFAHVAVTRAGQAARARSLVGWAPDLVEDGDADIAMLLTHAVLGDLIADGVTGPVDRGAA